MKKFASNGSSQKVLADILNRYVGRDRLYSTQEMAELCGVSASAIYQASQGNVGLETTRRILDNLPSECWTEFLSHWGFPQAVRFTEADGCHHEAGRELAGATAAYVDAASDGAIDHREHIKLTQRYHRVIAALSRITAAACHKFSRDRVASQVGVVR